MAQIKQIGPGRKTTGTIDGVTYVTRNGKTYVRSSPTMPASAYSTPAAKKRQAIFKFIQMHLKYHLRTIKQTFTNKGNGSPTNRYYSINGKALTLALDSLAELYLDGELITIDDIEAAISDYAAANPKAIVIASKSGYNEVYLEGEWPETITLNAKTGDSTVIIIVNELGEQTTINADGSVSVSSYQGSGSNGSNGSDGSNSSNGSNSSSQSEANGGSSANGANDNGNENENQNGGGNSGGSSSGGSSTGSETVTVEAPQFSGEVQFTDTTQVTISGPDGASIYYTVDGSTPTAESSQYSAPLTFSETTTLKAIAIKDGVSSSVTEGTYTKTDSNGGSGMDQN